MSPDGVHFGIDNTFELKKIALSNSQHKVGVEKTSVFPFWAQMFNND